MEFKRWNRGASQNESRYGTKRRGNRANRGANFVIVGGSQNTAAMGARGQYGGFGFDMVRLRSVMRKLPVRNLEDKRPH